MLHILEDQADFPSVHTPGEMIQTKEEPPNGYQTPVKFQDDKDIVSWIVTPNLTPIDAHSLWGQTFTKIYKLYQGTRSPCLPTIVGGQARFVWTFQSATGASAKGKWISHCQWTPLGPASPIHPLIRLLTVRIVAKNPMN